MPARVKLMVPYNSLELAGFVKVPSGDNCWLLIVKSIYILWGLSKSNLNRCRGKCKIAGKKRKVPGWAIDRKLCTLFSERRQNVITARSFRSRFIAINHLRVLSFSVFNLYGSFLFLIGIRPVWEGWKRTRSDSRYLLCYSTVKHGKKYVKLWWEKVWFWAFWILPVFN